MARPREGSIGLGQPAEFLVLGSYSFKLADTPEEQDQIERLLHQTFVLEVRQDEDRGTGRLIDKFHHKNKYLVAKRNGRICGAVAVHDRPPFSAATGLDDSRLLEQLSPRLLEVRRLAIEPGKRAGVVFPGLLWSVYEFARRGGYRYIVISGLLERQGMYEKMGFRQLGRPVRKGAAFFVPMLLDLLELPISLQQDRDRWQRRIGQSL